MKKIFVLLALGAMFFALCVPVWAQQTGKVFRIGFLDRSTSGSAVYMDAFRQEMSNLGWIEGKNIAIESRFAEGKTDRLPELAAELIRSKVDLIVTTGRAPALAAKSVTTAIPIVMMAFPDPVGEGLIATLARPGGNVTGFSGLSYELNTKRLEILKDTIPKLARVAILQQAGSNQQTPTLKESKSAAVALKLKLEEIEAEAGPKGLESALRTAKQKQVGAIMIGGGRVFLADRADRRACRQIQLAGYIPTEGICR